MTHDEATKMKKPQILIVEDDIDIRETLKEALELFDYSVAMASNGQEALENLEVLFQQDNLPELILLDIMMPVMNGQQFRAKQLANPKISHIPVVVLTADRDIGEKSLNLQASDSVPKPITLNSLEKIVRKYCTA